MLHNTQPTHNPFDAIQTQINSLIAICNTNSTKLDSILASPTTPTQSIKLTIAELAATFKISKPTIHVLMRKGEIPFEKIGRKTLFDRKTIELYFFSKERKIAQN